MEGVLTRSKSYPYTEEEKEEDLKFWRKHNESLEMMKKLGIEYSPVISYPHSRPDGMVSIHSLYDIFSDPEKMESLLERLRQDK